MRARWRQLTPSLHAQSRRCQPPRQGGHKYTHEVAVHVQVTAPQKDNIGNNSKEMRGGGTREGGERKMEGGGKMWGRAARTVEELAMTSCMASRAGSSFSPGCRNRRTTVSWSDPEVPGARGRFTPRPLPAPALPAAAPLLPPPPPLPPAPEAFPARCAQKEHPTVSHTTPHHTTHTGVQGEGGGAAQKVQSSVCVMGCSKHWGAVPHGGLQGRVRVQQGQQQRPRTAHPLTRPPLGTWQGGCSSWSSC